jgi:hypothetical protein
MDILIDMGASTIVWFTVTEPFHEGLVPALGSLADSRIGLIHDMSLAPTLDSKRVLLKWTCSCIHLCCHRKNPRFPLMELPRLITS